MRLREDIDPAKLIAAIRRCKGEVYFDTRDGDHLNMKSALSQFVFLGGAYERLDELGISLQVSDPADALILEEFARV